MVGTPEGSRVYIFYRHSLFAEGIRSLLANQPTVEIVGTESDKAKAFRDVKALRPSVVLIEECAADPEQCATWNFLHRQDAGRIIALNLEHNAATVYDREDVPISTPGDLLHAVRGYPRLPLPEESAPRPVGKSRRQAALKTKAPLPKGKTEPRKGRA